MFAKLRDSFDYCYDRVRFCITLYHIVPNYALLCHIVSSVAHLLRLYFVLDIVGYWHVFEVFGLPLLYCSCIATCPSRETKLNALNAPNDIYIYIHILLYVYIYVYYYNVYIYIYTYIT